MNKLNFQDKRTGDTLEASEWNQVVNKIDELVDASNSSGSGSSSGGSSSGGTTIDTSGVVSVNNKGNVTIGSNNIKNINLEPGYPYNSDTTKYGDIALKPGDDIQFASHHREPNKRDKIVIKNIDGSDNPVKLEVHSGEINLSVKNKVATRKKDKTTGEDTETAMFKADNAKVLDINIITGNTLGEGTNDERDERGYLKVRAQAIDLRCEKHGGIALQPKGYDNDGNMNKIKFEHGGGDGLEFGTFNTKKTSIFTDEYRFKKDGIWKMSVRETEASGKNILDEKEGGLGVLPATGALKYKKNNAANNASKSLADAKTYEPADDFYDFVDTEDAQTTTEAIIKTAAALNNDRIETSLSSKKNLKISASSTYKIIAYEGTAAGNELTYPVTDKNKSYSKDELKLILSGSAKLSDLIDTKLPFLIEGDEGIYRLSGDITPKISIEAEEEVDLDAKYGDVVITSGDTIKQEAPEIRLNAINADKSGGTVNFGATQNVIFLTNKLTASLNVEAASVSTKVKMMLQNNCPDTVYWDALDEVFRIPVKKLYLDNEHVNELSPSNYADGLPVYFADGTRVPMDYTCFIATQEDNGGVITTTVYKAGTKGSSNVLKKKLGEPVAVYVNDPNVATYTSGFGTASSNTIQNVEMEPSAYVGVGSSYTQESAAINARVIQCSPVASEEFVALKQVDLADIITIISELKTMKANNQGPWAS